MNAECILQRSKIGCIAATRSAAWPHLRVTYPTLLPARVPLPNLRDEVPKGDRTLVSGTRSPKETELRPAAQQRRIAPGRTREGVICASETTGRPEPSRDYLLPGFSTTQLLFHASVFARLATYYRHRHFSHLSLLTLTFAQAIV